MAQSRIRAEAPDVVSLESAMLDPAAAASSRAAARAALQAVALRSAARRLAFAQRARFRLFQRVLVRALTAIGKTTHAANVLAATDIETAIAMSGIDSRTIAAADENGLVSLITHITRRCGASRDAVIVAALDATTEAAGET